MEDEDGNTITFNEEGTHLIGTLSHLSGYALVGITNTPGAPDTGRFVNTSSVSLSLFAVIATLAIFSVAVVLKNNKL